MGNRWEAEKARQEREFEENLARRVFLSVVFVWVALTCMCLGILWW